MHWKWSLECKETEIAVKKSSMFYLPFNMLLLVIRFTYIFYKISKYGLPA